MQLAPPNSAFSIAIAHAQHAIEKLREALRLGKTTRYLNKSREPVLLQYLRGSRIEAIAAAVQRPTIRFVPIKSADRQGVRMLHGSSSGAGGRRHSGERTGDGRARKSWHDRNRPFPKDVRGASCFILRFDDRLVGITADHVIEAYKSDLRRTPTLVCQVRLLPFDLNAALINRDQELDIATFAVSEPELNAINAVAIDCRENWPPPKPDPMRAISLAGFPEIIRVIHPDRWAEFNAYGALPAVEDVTDKEIILTYDPARDRPLQSTALPPLGFNLSGYSGGPVLMHGTRNGLHRWFPVGLILGGPKDVGIGENASFDIIRARRIHHVKTDGSLDLRSSEWLPSY